MTELAITWSLLAGSIIIAAPAIWLAIKDSVDLQEDIKFSDNTIEEVAPPAILAAPTTEKAQ